MIYWTREEVERIGQAGSSMWVSPKGIEGTAFRYLSSFWLFVEEQDEAFSPHGPQGFWEAWITTWMSKQFDKHDHFVDVGANVGYYTMLACDHGIPTTAFEPNPTVAELLRKSAVLNKFFPTVYEQALSNRSGEFYLNIPDRHSGGAHLAYGQNTGVLVETVRAEEALPYSSERTLIKIDAEGAEPDIIEGAAGWFRHAKKYTILLEWDKTRFNATKFAVELFDLGSVFYVDTNGDERALIHPSQLAQLEGLQMVGVRKW